jgi:hypothetical protein
MFLFAADVKCMHIVIPWLKAQSLSGLAAIDLEDRLAYSVFGDDDVVGSL